MLAGFAMGLVLNSSPVYLDCNLPLPFPEDLSQSLRPWFHKLEKKLTVSLKFMLFLFQKDRCYHIQNMHG